MDLHMLSAASQPDRRRRRSQLILWLSLWAFLTLVGSALHWSSWIGPSQEPPIVTFLSSSGFKPLSNLSSVLAAPGWILSTLVLGRLHSSSLLVTLVAHAFAWFAWLSLIAFAVELWRVLARLATRPRAAEPATAASPNGSPTPPGPASLSRRRLLIDAAFVTGAFSSSSALGYATLVEPFAIGVAHYRVPIRGLDQRLDGLRIVQIGDTHLGPRVRSEFIERALAEALALKPDVFALVGDYIHAGRRQIEPAARLFRPLIASGIPVVGVMGNHDWYASGPESAAALRAVGVNMLDNDRLFLDPDRRTLIDAPVPGAIALCGVGDLWTDHIDVRSAFRDVPGDMPRVLLAHNPDTAEQPVFRDEKLADAVRRVDLMLSGHTHGGQVRLPILGTPIVPSDFGQRYAHGLVQGPVCPVVITAGIGVSLIPVRFGVPPEIVEITLVRSA